MQDQKAQEVWDAVSDLPSDQRVGAIHFAVVELIEQLGRDAASYLDSPAASVTFLIAKEVDERFKDLTLLYSKLEQSSETAHSPE